MYKLCFYVPPSHLDTVKSALFNAGAGRLGNYDSCCWQTVGEGQYRPLENSDAYSGEINKISFEKEYKVEMIFKDELLESVVTVLKKAHPYEEPAYQIIKIYQPRVEMSNSSLE